MVAFAIWGVSVAFKGMGPSPEVVFEALLGDPSEVEVLDGFVQKGDGYAVQIRFVAGDDWVRSLPSRGFSETDCGHVRQIINFSLLRVAVWPPWRPEDVDQPTCFSRVGKNEWSPQGRDFVLANKEGGFVYFAGEGREHDRALPGADEVTYPEDQ